jgi:hypothetical protein
MPSLPGTKTAAATVGRALRDELAGHRVPANVLPLGDCAAVSLWYELVAWTDGRRIWWICPQQSRRGHDLYTFAYHPATAAARLAAQYAEAQAGLPAVAGASPGPPT